MVFNLSREEAEEKEVHYRDAKTRRAVRKPVVGRKGKQRQIQLDVGVC